MAAHDEDMNGLQAGMEALNAAPEVVNQETVKVSREDDSTSKDATPEDGATVEESISVEKLAAEADKPKDKNSLHAVVVNHFNEHYSDCGLETWQAICRDVGVEQGDTIKQCQKKLKKARINVFDFVEAHKKGELPKHFKSVKELSRYTFDNGKMFPLKKARHIPILRCMLIKVF